MAYKIFTDGSAGTTGLQLKERLEKYISAGAVEMIALPEELRKDNSAKAAAMNGADLVFLCLPDDAARESVALITNPAVRVIDTSTAHRIADGWTYGFPELYPGQTAKIRAAKRAANPGCHATGVIALLAPIIAEGVVAADYPFAITSITGYSGGGKGMIAEYESAGRPAELDAPRAYALTSNHKHLPEIIKYSGLARVPAFIPIVADYPQGMQVIIQIHSKERRRIFDVLERHYAAAKNIEVLFGGDENFSTSNLNAGTDKMTINVFGNDDIAVLTARFDNLGKGAAGAAIQNMCLMLGIDYED